MNKHLKRYLFLILAVACFILAGFLEYGLIQKHPEKHLLKSFQKKVLQKEEKLDKLIDEISGIVTSEDFEGQYLASLHQFNDYFQKDGYGFLVYEKEEIKYWSNQAISFQEDFPVFSTNLSMVVLPNGYYLAKSVETGMHKIIGLITIKNDYAHENNYLENAFQHDFNLPSDYLIVDQGKKYSIPIYDTLGNYLFSVLPVGKVLCSKSQLIFPGLLYLLGLILILIYFRIEFKRSDRTITFKLFVLGAGLFIIYWIHLLFKIPNIFYYLNFFSPSHFAYNMWLPSLGDYFLLATFFCFWAINFYFDFRIKTVAEDSLINIRLITKIFLLLNGLLFIVVDFFIGILVRNSSISLSLNRITELSFHSAIGYFSIGMLLLGLILTTIRIIDDASASTDKKQIMIYSSVIILIFAVFQIIFQSRIDLPIDIFFLLFIFLTLFLGKPYYHKFTLSYLIIIVSIISMYTLFTVYSVNRQKEREQQKLLAVKLVAEQDPAAEVLLGEIQRQINVDPNIAMKLVPPFEELEDYLAVTYFNGFFRKYDLQITTCVGADSLEIQPENITVPCFAFFDEMINEEGMPIPDTHFYFMDKMNGRISYFGKLFFPLAADSIGVTVFIELMSRMTAEGLGYPELLLDKSMLKPEVYKKFTYAKYYNGLLVDRHGEYKYNFDIRSYNIKPGEMNRYKWDQKEHLVFNTGDDNYVIVSRSMYLIFEYLISFPYLFVFFLLLTIVLLLIGNKTMQRKSRVIDLKFKIQAAIISIVFFSLLVVAVGTIFYNVKQYKAKHREDLNEKMKSISEEIYMRLGSDDSIQQENIDWLYRELAKLSNIFRTDINIFGTDGELLATSRQEIYDQGLISTRINSEAYFELFQNFKISYFQPEQIGTLSYLSAYEPIINNQGKYLGFINLPYFTRQDKYRQEISTYIVAFINLYVILFLASIIIAVFISNQITLPLTLVRENLRKMELGKHNEPIYYEGDDEIGSLVKEYNKKVDELATSAELLARSERESAWREMAKQIAHEIKNPLTPMKLNIQHLQRSFKDKGKENENIDRLTKTLIEQIDDLSEIATEFSNFAKIPTARNHIFSLSNKIRKVTDLFESHDRAIIRVVIKDENINVNADREQLSRALINLIKNGIQAIPAGIKGEIIVSLERIGDKALIKVKDNGSGIPEEMRGKLFSPSFTTKSSGMGLGLSIVKGIVENFSGRIWFETKINKGSTFFVEIPIYENEDNNT